jgi:hypothetical protein
MKKIFLVLFLSFIAPAEGANSEGMLCKLEGKDATLRYKRYDTEVIRLQFTGLEPVRFFSRTGKGIYTQFATQKNLVSPLVNRERPASKIKVEVLYGGERFTWFKGKEKLNYDCSHKD